MKFIELFLLAIAAARWFKLPSQLISISCINNHQDFEKGASEFVTWLAA